MLGDTPHAPCTGSNISTDRIPASYLHPLDIVKAVLKIEEVLLPESIPTADDLPKSEQQQDVSGRLLL